MTLEDVGDVNSTLTIPYREFLAKNDLTINERYCDVLVVGLKEWIIPMNSLVQRSGSIIVLRDRFRDNGCGVLAIEFSDRTTAPIDIYFTNDVDTGTFLSLKIMERNDAYSSMICEKLNLGYSLPYPELSTVYFAVLVEKCHICLSLGHYSFENSMWKAWVLHNVFLNNTGVDEMVKKIQDEESNIQCSIRRFGDFAGIF